MKKFLSLLFALCLLVSVTACSSGTGTPTKEEAAAPAETPNAAPKEAEDGNFGLNETAVFDNMKITASNLKETKGKEYFEAEDGKVFVGVKFEIENTSDKAQTVSSMLFFDAYVDDVKCDFSLNANVSFSEGTIDGEISPGKKLVGWYAVEAPEEWNKLELEFKADWLSDTKAVFVFDAAECEKE